MKIERGLEHRGIRLSLILHSEDVLSHSEMSNSSPAFEKFADEVRDLAEAKLCALVDLLKGAPDAPGL